MASRRCLASRVRPALPPVWRARSLPDSHAALIDALAGYRARAGESYALRRWRGLAQARLDAALNHTQQASADNGGAALAAGGHQPAYLLDTPPATLWTQLCDTHQQVSLPLRLSDLLARWSPLVWAAACLSVCVWPMCSPCTRANSTNWTSRAMCEPTAGSA